MTAIEVKERTIKPLTAIDCQHPQIIEKTITVRSIIDRDAIFMGLRNAARRVNFDLKRVPIGANLIKLNRGRARLMRQLASAPTHIAYADKKTRCALATCTASTLLPLSDIRNIMEKLAAIRIRISTVRNAVSEPRKGLPRSLCVARRCSTLESLFTLIAGSMEYRILYICPNLQAELED